MIDVIFLAHGRPEFTAASLNVLVQNTEWDLVGHLIVYTDGDAMPGSYAAWRPAGGMLEYKHQRHGGPVPVMLDYISGNPCPLFAKIDNDVIVPPGWLEACAEVMQECPELDLLGIEPPDSRTPAPWALDKPVDRPEDMARPKCLYYADCDSVGGIGLFRTAAFHKHPDMRPFASGRGGFTDWQLRHKDVRKGWIVPPLNLFLLDRLTSEPWASLSRRYEAQGQQRPWTKYSPEAEERLTAWWK